MKAAARWLLVLSLSSVGCGGGDGGSNDDDDSNVGSNGDGSVTKPREDGGNATDGGTLGDSGNDRPDAIIYTPPPDCGDGKVGDGEDCDDGNVASADGCDLTCHREVGFNCPAMAGACVPICGDRMMVLGEGCDDGGSEAGDGCSETCQVEPGWSCVMSGAPCVAAGCGDGVIAGAETCDDGNDVPGDGCDVGCQIEAGWVCAVAHMSCTAARCGDGVRAGTEACDDGGNASKDGCSATCDSVEPNYSCPDAGGACVRTSVCGNGILTSDEECDDRNSVDGDGCSKLCMKEAGWQCTTVGRACTAAKCGDKYLAGSEQCEDGNTTTGDGCAECQIESGWACTFSNGVSTCHKAVCGDKKVEGNETCDDGNDVVGDGCGPNCAIEPTCAVGSPCQSTCGDGIRLPSDTNEQCDDGNVRDNDGCSSTCKIESGFTCKDVTSVLPDTFNLTVVYRDFIRAVAGGSTQHPDFETFSGSNASTGMVGPTLVSGKPTYTGICEKNKTLAAICGGDTTKTAQPQTTSESRFNQWYANAPIAGVMQKFVQTVVMTQQKDAQGKGTGAYRNPSFGQQLFPLDALGWVHDGLEAASGGHNFGFTTEIHHWFQFNGGEVLTFSGDDDVWVFIGGKLALDMGGLHSQIDRTISISNTGVVSCFIGTTASGTSCGTTNLGLTAGNVYEMALFHAERHTTASNFNLTLNGFVSAKSQCTSRCGDGIITAGEVCDDGSACAAGANAGQACTSNAGCPGSTCVSKNDGTYGHCNATCDDYGPHCGDATKQSSEQCDDGSDKNLGKYNGCTAQCTLGPKCGDAKVDGFYGEQCDLGTAMNTGGYNGCTAGCKFGDRCGDGIMQSNEECDDGMNTGAYGKCAPGCKLGARCGDGVVDRSGGEECDDGATNDGHYGGCSMTCKKASRCGDRITDTAAGETCDDGNLNDYDGCSPTCKQDIYI